MHSGKVGCQVSQVLLQDLIGGFGRQFEPSAKLTKYPSWNGKV